MPKEGKFAVFDDTGYRYRNEAMARILAPVRSVIRTHAEMIQTHIRVSMNQTKSGRTYYRPGGRIHTASAPGESPAVDTGKLLNQILIRYRFGGMQAEVGAFDVVYATFLENGTRRMAKRPFLAPAVADIEPRFYDAMRAAIAAIGARP